jgi:hypothetical protein
MTIIGILPSIYKITIHQISSYSPDIVRLLAPLAQCVGRWTITAEARVQIRVSTQIIYYRADTVLWHKKDSNMACVMRSGFAIAIWTISVPHKERYTEFMHAP